MKDQIIKKLIESVSENLQNQNLTQIISDRNQLPTFIENAHEQGYILDYRTLNCTYLTETKDGTIYTLNGARWVLEAKILTRTGQAGGNRPGNQYEGVINEAVVEVKYDEESGEPSIQVLKLDVSTDYTYR